MNTSAEVAVRLGSLSLFYNPLYGRHAHLRHALVLHVVYIQYFPQKCFVFLVKNKTILSLRSCIEDLEGRRNQIDNILF